MTGVCRRKKAYLEDRYIIDEIVMMMRQSTQEIDPARLVQISKNGNLAGGTIFFEVKPGDRRSTDFVYDSLYEIGYFILGTARIDPGNDFFRYLYSLQHILACLQTSKLMCSNYTSEINGLSITG